ncbi:MAG: hypothetical protein Q9221_005519 [Calogaya cf. arnoldii]
MSPTISAILLTVLPFVTARPPALHQRHAAGVPEQPLITPSPTLPEGITKTIQRRNILDDVKGEVKGILSDLGSAIPSYVASGIPDFFQDFPVGDDAQKSLGIDDDQYDRGYGNWTDRGWNLRFHGNIYKQPPTSEEKLNDLANIFLIDTSIEELAPDQQAQTRNLTASIFVLQQDNENVTMSLRPAPTAGASGEQGGGGAVTPSGGSQQVRLPDPTTEQGDFDAFVQIESDGLADGNSTNDIQRLNVYAEGSNIGNATAYLVPPTGFTIISDIDDILRITKIYQPKEGLLNSFARPFVAWKNMPEIYANWSRSIPDFHFHYLTTTPEQITRNYMDFIYKTYPGGSFDTRPLNFSDISATLAIRKFLLDKIFETYPERKFILVADTSNSDVMKAYPQMTKDFPGQVQCIFLRNTSATDDGNRFPYDTSGFQDLDKNIYMFFKVPDDLKNLDIQNGQCLNSTIPQNLTFSWQGLPFGLSKDSQDSAAAPRYAVATSWLGMVFAVGLAAAFL